MNKEIGTGHGKGDVPSKSECNLAAALLKQ